jgi:hypothetical protein
MGQSTEQIFNDYLQLDKIKNFQEKGLISEISTVRDFFINRDNT